MITIVVVLLLLLIVMMKMNKTSKMTMHDDVTLTMMRTVIQEGKL